MMHFWNWLKDLLILLQKRLFISNLSDSDDDFYLLTSNSNVNNTAETKAEDVTGDNPNVLNESSHNNEFANFSQKKESCNKSIKSTWQLKFCIAWICLLSILGKDPNLNHEDNILPYFVSYESVAYQLTKHLYGNQYKIYLIRFSPQFHCSKFSHWKCSIKKTVGVSF